MQLSPFPSFSTAERAPTLASAPYPGPVFTPHPLPVVYSTLAPQALIPWTMSHYDIPIPQACRLWHRGLSDIYLLETATENYILRISHHHWRTASDINFELELLTFLAQRQLPVAAPLTTQEGKLAVPIQALEGCRYATLFPQAPGTVAIGDLNISQSWLLGEIVANIHTVAQSFHTQAKRQPLSLAHLLDESLTSLAAFWPLAQAEWQSLREICIRIKHQLQALPTEPPYWGICWGDPHSGNVHFTDSNQPTLFDFDQCGYGWRAFDVAKFLQVATQTGLSRQVREAFLKGYQAVSPLTSLELVCLPSLTQAAYLWSWAIQVNNLKLQDCSRLDYHYFAKRLERLRYLACPDLALF
ncbi:phosphotransferase [Synechocystis sp. LKSZ1]|uniref:phosphotransferase n=1 Tax=Synechocystis sp. LKSZ1 TaxID=3144951 RepID=UPI00336C113F